MRKHYVSNFQICNQERKKIINIEDKITCMHKSTHTSKQKILFSSCQINTKRCSVFESQICFNNILGVGYQNITHLMIQPWQHVFTNHHEWIQQADSHRSMKMDNHTSLQFGVVSSFSLPFFSYTQILLEQRRLIVIKTHKKFITSESHTHYNFVFTMFQSHCHITSYTIIPQTSAPFRQLSWPSNSSTDLLHFPYELIDIRHFPFQCLWIHETFYQTSVTTCNS